MNVNDSVIIFDLPGGPERTTITHIDAQGRILTARGILFQPDGSHVDAFGGETALVLSPDDAFNAGEAEYQAAAEVLQRFKSTMNALSPEEAVRIAKAIVDGELL